MPPSKPSRDSMLRDEDGSAALEFITAGFLLLIPLVYLILAMAAIQGGALSVEGASRQAARVLVQAPTAASASARAQTAVDFALDDFGISRSSAKVRITCRPRPATCLTRRGFVTVTVTASVALPLLPSVLTLRTPLSIPLSATSTEQVSRFWGGGS
jgi:Flp pilus assembly protein TadG